MEPMKLKVNDREIQKIIAEELMKYMNRVMERTGDDSRYAQYLTFCICGGRILKEEGEMQFAKHVKEIRAKNPIS